MKKKKKLPRKKLRPIKLLKADLWELCKKIVRIRDGESCFTCGAFLQGNYDKQTGHFIPSSTCGLFLRYDLRNLRLQCSRCNIYGGGQGAEFNRRLTALFGTKWVDEIFEDKNVIVENEREFIGELIFLYKGLLEDETSTYKGMDIHPSYLESLTKAQQDEHVYY
jgi:Bacteriophage Lambda NinG protein